MSTAMIMKPYVAIRREGLGDPVTDAMNAMLTPLTQQIDAKITVTKREVLLEVQKQGREAKIYAVAGGFVAGLLGGYLARRFL